MPFSRHSQKFPSWALGQHREATRGSNHLGGSYFRAVADGLVEVFLFLGDAVFQDGVADEFGIVRLVAHQQIDGAEDPFADVFDDLGALGADIDGTLRHGKANLRKTFLIFVKMQP